MRMISEVAREVRSRTRHVARREHGLERLLQPGLVERDAAVAELDESLRVGLDELDRVAQLRQPDRADEADVAGPDDGDVRGALPPVLSWAGQ